MAVLRRCQRMSLMRPFIMQQADFINSSLEVGLEHSYAIHMYHPQRCSTKVLVINQLFFALSAQPPPVFLPSPSYKMHPPLSLSAYCASLLLIISPIVQCAPRQTLGTQSRPVLDCKDVIIDFDESCWETLDLTNWLMS